jgi:hypothetical protein
MGETHTDNGAPMLALICLSDSFQFSMSFYFHLSFTGGREVAFFYHVANALQLFTFDMKFC